MTKKKKRGHTPGGAEEMVRIVNLKPGAQAASWWAKPNGIVLVEVNSFLGVVHSRGDLTYSFAFHIGDHFYSC